MNEPGYQSDVVNKEYVFKDLIKIFPKHEDIVNVTLDDYLKEKQGFGSSQGYEVFIKKDLINLITSILRNED